MWPFKKKGKKKAEKLDKAELLQISSNKILVKVYKHFGSNTSFLKAEYIAVEKRDNYKNLISINADYAHNEDTDFTIDDVYREMQVILEFKNYTKDKKLEILDRKIKYQEKLLTYLRTFPELNAAYNYADEFIKSTDYKLLRNYISKHDESGAYFSIEKGMRVYSFESVDGFLVPIWHGIDTYSQYPDHTRKLKITIQEDQRMRQEMREYNKERKIGQALSMALIMNIILFSILLFAAYKVWDKNNSMDDKIHASAYQCAEYTSKINTEITQILENTVVKELLAKSQQQQTIPQETKDIGPPTTIS